MQPPLRLVARLDVKGPNLVKGIHLEGLRALGDPAKFAKLYYESGIDELLYMDPVASLYGRNYAQDLVRRLSGHVFVPMSVGGGIRSLADVQEVLASGADRVIVNTAAIAQPKLISDVARAFGSSTISVSVNAIHRSGNKYEVLAEGGRQPTNIDVLEWVSRVQDLGAGELAITSIDREGTGKGFDLRLLQEVLEIARVPILIGGGCGSVNHIIEAATLGVDGVIIASMLHYSLLRELVHHVPNASGEGNFSFLQSRQNPKEFEDTTIKSIRQTLLASGFSSREIDAS